DLTDEQLADLLSDYDIGNVLSFKGIAEGVENSNFLLTTERESLPEKFILTLYEKRVNPKDLPFFINLMTHLAESGLPCPVPVKRKDGSTLSNIAGRPAAIISFLEGLSLRRPEAVHCHALGASKAEMHLAAQHFGMTRANNLSIDAWPELYETSQHNADTLHAGLTELIDSELARLKEHWPNADAALPRGIIHADLFADNVFFIGDKLSGIIDFYFACSDIMAYDLAIVLNAWCFETDTSFNITKARALMDGYNSVRKLTPEEIEALPILASGAAMRFLLTRLHDWFAPQEGALVKPKNPLDYLHRLRFHKKTKSAAEYGVEL
ncbi:MAG: homoserine kinase, partial [Pseudomonadota bacterium]|nr:homoserine kinase [Pseudomonadota bacterium]